MKAKNLNFESKGYQSFLFSSVILDNTNQAKCEVKTMFTFTSKEQGQIILDTINQAISEGHIDSDSIYDYVVSKVNLPLLHVRGDYKGLSDEGLAPDKLRGSRAVCSKSFMLKMSVKDSITLDANEVRGSKHKKADVVNFQERYFQLGFSLYCEGLKNSTFRTEKTKEFTTFIRAYK